MRETQLYFARLLGLSVVLFCGCPSKQASLSAKRTETEQAQAPSQGTTAAEAQPPAKITGTATEPAAATSEHAQLFKDWPRPDVALVLTGQQLGYIEPCGCTGLENQKGGLARRHTLLRQLTGDLGWAVVPLDVGSQVQVKRFGKQQEVKFAHAVQGLRTMGYRAATLGDGDLRLTPGELLATLAGADGTVSDFVSSNVAVLARDLQPRFIVIEAGGK